MKTPRQASRPTPKTIRGTTVKLYPATARSGRTVYVSVPPSACRACGGDGCTACKGTGYAE